jgi:hypothetical protein
MDRTGDVTTRSILSASSDERSLASPKRIRSVVVGEVDRSSEVPPKAVPS